MRRAGGPLGGPWAALGNDGGRRDRAPTTRCGAPLRPCPSRCPPVSTQPGGTPQTEGTNDQRVAVLVMADRLAEPRRRHMLRMLVGQKDAAHHMVALPHHPHLLRGLDEINRLERIEQLTRHAARIAAGLGREWDS